MGRSLSPPPAKSDAEPSSIIRRLIRSSGHRDAPDTSDEAPTVILDIRVDGFRCILIRQPERAEPAPPHRSPLSPREVEIARMVAKGLPNKTIARVLDISMWTVGTYLRRIFAKLGVSTRAAMVAKLKDDESASWMGTDSLPPPNISRPIVLT